jgi:hypothetical protein
MLGTFRQNKNFSALWPRCYNDDMIRRLRARTEAGRLEFKHSTQCDIAMPVSFKGFGQAALMKE